MKTALPNNLWRTRIYRGVYRILLVAMFSGACPGHSEAPLPAGPAEFAVPQPGRQFVFPRDHGSHPEFAIEWWYVTGHLFGTNAARYGFQATFFRRALAPPNSTHSSTSPAFRNDQIYLAHATLTDQTAGTFRFQERLNRAGWDADSATNTLALRNGNWLLRLLPENSTGTTALQLQLTVGADVALTLELVPRKPQVIFGTNSVSRKAADPAAASHYLTFPRLAATGTLTLGETNQSVTGEAWMDHEFSTSQVGAGQVGWDWLSIQFFDHREIMAYRMRRTDGATDPFSTLAWVDTKGTIGHVGPDRFQWTTLAKWHSPKSGADYPTSVRLTAFNPATGKQETFTIEPVVANQELAGQAGGISYWEGACRVRDEAGKEIGRAYLELTGYAQSLKGKF